MTRDEAIQRFLEAKKIGLHGPMSSQWKDVGRIIDGLAAIGLIKFEEPKTPAQKVADYLIKNKYTLTDLSIFQEALSANNLKIVEK